MSGSSCRWAESRAKPITQRIENDGFRCVLSVLCGLAELHAADGAHRDQTAQAVNKLFLRDASGRQRGI